MNEIKTAIEALKAVQAVAQNSEGIAGWHKNGDIASWEELLPEVDAALAALAASADSAQEREEALHTWIAERYGTSFDSFTYSIMDEAFEAGAAWQSRASLAAKVEQEPYAWACIPKSGNTIITTAYSAVADQWRRNGDEVTPLFAAQQAQQEEKDVQDAARYRWLRDEHERIDPMAAVVWKRSKDRNSSDWVNTGCGADLDITIDAAMQASPQAEAQPTKVCGVCRGSGWIVRDPDIGTDQECFACDGTGTVDADEAQQSKGESK